MDSEYTKFFDSIANECDISNLSEHTLGALFWDKQQGKIDKIEQQLKEANEVIEFYSEFWEGDLGTSTYAQKGNDLEYMKESGHGKWKAGKTARQYLTKYKVKE
tara:strand:- start:281 stop:592 length:312 start_codon:yes stop_codon:yes gene_type:complete